MNEPVKVETPPIVDGCPAHQALLLAYHIAAQTRDWPPETRGEAHMLAESIGRMAAAMRPPCCDVDEYEDDDE